MGNRRSGMKLYKNNNYGSECPQGEIWQIRAIPYIGQELQSGFDMRRNHRNFRVRKGSEMTVMSPASYVM